MHTVGVNLDREDYDRLLAWTARELDEYATISAGLRLALRRQGVIGSKPKKAAT